MKVILKQNVAALGKAGEVVDVSDGHARNFLIPRGLAAEATDKNINALAEERKRISQRKEKEQKKAEELAAAVSGVICKIRRRVGEQDKLFGSVGAKDIQAALQDQGYEIERKAILLDDPIKSLGEFPVKVRIHAGMTADIKVLVVADPS